jgi:hypothetical protein
MGCGHSMPNSVIMATATVELDRYEHGSLPLQSVDVKAVTSPAVSRERRATEPLAVMF